MNFFEIQTNKPGAKKSYSRIIRIRNPFGEEEWKGKWSRNSDEVIKYRELIEEKNSCLEDNIKINLDSNDGCFLMNYFDFRNIFTDIYICHEFSSDWNGIRFKGNWNSSNSGGLPKENDIKSTQKYSINPQIRFYLKNSSNVEFLINLIQDDGIIIKVDLLKRLNFLIKALSSLVVYPFLNYLIN